MIEIIAVLVIGVFLTGTVWYIPVLWRGAIKPAPATWIIGTVALNISSLSYFAAAKGTLQEKVVGNVLLLGATVEITVVTAVFLVSLWWRGELKVAFDWFQKLCFMGMFLALTPWLYDHKNAYLTFWTTQLLFVVAYFATIGKVRARKASIDSLVHWSSIFLASLLGAIPAWSRGNIYGEINSVRSILSSGGLLFLLFYFDKKNGWEQWRREFAVWKRSFNVFGIAPEREM